MQGNQQVIDILNEYVDTHYAAELAAAPIA